MKNNSKIILLILIALSNLSNAATKDNYAQTEEKLNSAIKKHKNDDIVIYQRALFYYRFHKDELSLQDVTKAIKLSPEKYLYYSFRANLYLELNKPAEAFQDINTLFKMDKTIPDSYIPLGLYYLNMDSLQLAYNNFNKAISIYESNNAECTLMSRCYSERGRLNFAFGNIDAAINDFTKSIAKVRDSKKDNLLMLRANAHLSKNDTQNGFQDIGSALALHPDSMTLGFIYALQANKNKVDEIVPAIIAKKSINVCCKEGINMYNIACYYAILNDKEKALEFLEKSLQLGYDKFNWIQADYDMRNIRSLPQFNQLIQKYQTKK